MLCFLWAGPYVAHCTRIFSALTTTVRIRHFSTYLLFEGQTVLRQTCRAAGGGRYSRRADTCSTDESVGKLGGTEVMGCLGFRFSEAVRSLSCCSFRTLLSVPELPEAVRHFASRDWCVPISVHGSRLPFRRRSSWNKSRGGPRPQRSEPGTMHEVAAPTLAAPSFGQLARYPLSQLACGAWGAAEVLSAQLTRGCGREAGAWPGAGGGPRGGES